MKNTTISSDELENTILQELSISLILSITGLREEGVADFMWHRRRYSDLCII